jgi:hypothetical protein
VASEFESKLAAVAGIPDSASEALVVPLRKESALRDKASQAGQLMQQLQQQVSSLSMQAKADVRRLSSEGELVQQLLQEVSSLSAQKSAAASEFESKLVAVAGKPDSRRRR